MVSLGLATVTFDHSAKSDKNSKRHLAERCETNRHGANRWQLRKNGALSENLF